MTAYDNKNVDPFVGKYYSTEWVRKHILRQNNEEIAEIFKQIENEINTGIIETPDPAEQEQAQQPVPKKPAKNK